MFTLDKKLAFALNSLIAAEFVSKLVLFIMGDLKENRTSGQS